jgi:very-short-patch-repair endonuclease
MTRYNILRKHSTQDERRVYEVLKELHIPFRHRWLIGGMEVDFLIGKTIIEIDGHNQKVDKNNKLLELGFIPLHLSNEVTKNPTYLKDYFKTYKLWELP